MAPVIRNLFLFATASRSEERTTSLGSPALTVMVSDSEQHRRHRRRRSSHHKEGEEHRRRRRKSHRTHSIEEMPEKHARESHGTAKGSEGSEGSKKSHSRRDRASTVSRSVNSSSNSTARSPTASGERAKESTRREPPIRNAMQRAVAESWTRFLSNPSPISIPLRLGQQSDRQPAKQTPRSPAPKDKSRKQPSPEKQGKRSGGARKLMFDIPASRSVAERTVSCLTCFDDIPVSKAAQLACSHSMCEDCLERIFTISVTDPQLMPPKCCTSDHIPLKHVDSLFDVEFKIKWNKKYQEYTTKNRIYCPTKDCGEWIKPRNIHVDTSGGATGGRRYGICGSCNTKVCGLCNGKWHTGSECPKDDDMRRFVNAAKENGWQRCYNCSAMVELHEGCNHMTCRCGAEFCILCAAMWKTCACPWFNNYRHVELQPPAGILPQQVQVPQHAAHYAPVPIPMAEVAAPAPAPFYAQRPAGYQFNPNQPPFQPIAIHNAMPYATNVTGIFIAPFEDGGYGEHL
ncbi:hypothetical protein EMCG_04284 [[Emmonsia] crescens]|uniref:RBR-type E3 ubiquitin transferase n=1 Tax=[Emmonsia] crescens TaxID=73230 RepID=A0A0G2HSS8_9EURO|nr:hypothetical protein EMCG_04284 [Emmonsia crescens UAMH 3008]